MQISEVSSFGVRTSVTVFRHRDGPLRFTLVPVIHIGRPDYYRRIAHRLGSCNLVVAETIDGPSSTGLAYVLAMRMTRQRRGGTLVHQDINYQRLGVPTVWPDDMVKPGGRDRLPWYGWLDVALLLPYLIITMAVGGRGWLLRRNFEISDDSEPRMPFLNRTILVDRDNDLVAALTSIHAEHQAEMLNVAVAYGAAHFPAVVRALTRLGYRPQPRAEWLTAIDF